MAIIYETSHFLLESKEKPEVDRKDGWHLVINPKISVLDRTFLTPKQAIELMRLTIISGRAMVTGLWKRGISIGRINYQDNGNWRKELHIHLYWRAVNSVFQKFGDPIISGYKPEYMPLDEEDIICIKEEIDTLLKLEELSDRAWGV
jgi:diadenosine tetraphosphate (Ap4A) HIT family hydrolase